MPHTYAQNTVHIIYSTKDRRKSIPKEFQPGLWAYIAGICKNHAIFTQAIGGAPTTSISSSNFRNRCR